MDTNRVTAVEIRFFDEHPEFIWGDRDAGINTVAQERFATHGHDHIGIGQADDRPEYLRTLHAQGFDEHTNTDTVMSDDHDGAMLTVGYQMMEQDDE